MHSRIKLVVILWICALLASACGAFEIGIEGKASSSGEVNWQATAEALQVEATARAGNMSQPVSLLAVEPEPTMVPEIVPSAHDQAMLAYVQGGDIWVKAIPDGEAQRLTTDGRNQEPRWSAGGHWLTFVKNPDFPELWAIRSDGSSAQPIENPGSIGAYAWSPVEDKLAIGVQGGIQLLPFDKEKPGTMDCAGGYWVRRGRGKDWRDCLESEWSTIGLYLVWSSS